ncbi:MAG TPA: LamG domain-containing protein [Candidatus Kapabacteria bacterium]|nr:LamG domain-containing protein [Candidatus Kapabacteria bacterium]HPO62404.1 LamG domain-containing protein [Candidatus Kapabacteria bacterium]
MKNYLHYFCLTMIISLFVIHPLKANIEIKFDDGTNFGPFNQGCSQKVDFRIKVLNLDASERDLYEVHFEVRKIFDGTTESDSFSVPIHKKLLSSKLYAEITDYETGFLPDTSFILAKLVEKSTQNIISEISNQMYSAPFPLNIDIISIDSVKSIYYQMRTNRSFSLKYSIGDSKLSLNLKNLQVSFLLIDSSEFLIKNLHIEKDKREAIVNINLNEDYEIPFSSVLRVNLNFKGAVKNGVNYDMNIVVSAPEIELESTKLLSDFTTNNFGKTLKEAWHQEPVPPNETVLNLKNVPWRTTAIIPTIVYLNNEFEYLESIKPDGKRYFDNSASMKLNLSNWPLDSRKIRFRFVCEGVENDVSIDVDFNIYPEPNCDPEPIISIYPVIDYISGYQQGNPKNDSIPTIDQSFGNIMEFYTHPPVETVDSTVIVFLDSYKRILKSFTFKDPFVFSLFTQFVDLSQIPYSAKWVQAIFYFKGGNPAGYKTNAKSIDIFPPFPNISISEYMLGEEVNLKEFNLNFIRFSSINPSISKLIYEIYNPATKTSLYSKEMSKNTVPYEYSLEFDGKNSSIFYETESYASTPTAYSQFFNGTISAYFKTNSSKGGTIVSTAIHAVQLQEQIPVMEISVLNNGKVQATIGYEDADKSVKIKRFTSDKRYNDDEWHFVALVRDDKILKLYIDGDFVADEELCSDCKPMFYYATYSKFSLNIGNSKVSDTLRNSHFEGAITNVAFWTDSYKNNIIKSIIYKDTSDLEYDINNNTLFYFSLNNDILDISGKFNYFNQTIEGIDKTNFKMKKISLAVLQILICLGIIHRENMNC